MANSQCKADRNRPDWSTLPKKLLHTFFVLAYRCSWKHSARRLHRKDVLPVSQTYPDRSNRYTLLHSYTCLGYEWSSPCASFIVPDLHLLIATQDEVFIIIQIIPEHFGIELVVTLLLLLWTDYRLATAGSAGRQGSSWHHNQYKYYITHTVNFRHMIVVCMMDDESQSLGYPVVDMCFAAWG